MKAFFSRIAASVARWIFEHWKATIREEGKREAQDEGAERLNRISEEQEKARASPPSDDDLLKRLRG